MNLKLSLSYTDGYSSVTNYVCTLFYCKTVETIATQIDQLVGIKGRWAWFLKKIHENGKFCQLLSRKKEVKNSRKFENSFLKPDSTIQLSFYRGFCCDNRT